MIWAVLLDWAGGDANLCWTNSWVVWVWLIHDGLWLGQVGPLPHGISPPAVLLSCLHGGPRALWERQCGKLLRPGIRTGLTVMMGLLPYLTTQSKSQATSESKLERWFHLLMGISWTYRGHFYDLPPMVGMLGWL